MESPVLPGFSVSGGWGLWIARWRLRLGVLCTPEGGIIRLIPEAHLRLATLVKIRSWRIFDSGF
ncbi:MAG: hypothetical protein ACE37N_07770, partial [Pseudohongiellaceae bacterium]